MLYEPREDSYLLAKWVRKLARGKVLDMGTGSAIQAETAKASTAVTSVLAADINPEAVAHARTKGIKAVQSDFFSDVPGTFDTIIFNPPYLPDEPGYKDVALDGGKEGWEVLGKFLAQLSAHLEPDGIGLIILSSSTGKERIDGIIARHGLEKEHLDTQHIGFEDLIIYAVRKTTLTKLLEKKGVKGIELFAKGHRGLIYTGTLGRKKVAVKAQRPDTDARGTVDNEAKRLKMLNKKGIGPKLLFSGKDHFAYEFVSGVFIQDFVASASRKAILKVLKEVFLQMRTLDKLGLNKEEMHHPLKHVVVTPKGKAVLLDFERCRPGVKVHNVTQFCQFLRSTAFNALLRERGVKIDGEKLMQLAKTYSHDVSERRFKDILAVLK